MSLIPSSSHYKLSPKSFTPVTAVIAAAAGMLFAASGCTQTPQVMAPPIQSAQQMSAPLSAPPMDGSGNGMNGGQGASASPSVYQWQDVPTGQQVPVVRAVFDQGGYQIYCQTGETIVVPFANQNLYVMKFGLSNNGSTYFVNDGQAPTLYVPRGGYLENTAAANSHWYPFPQNYAYTQPVYIGLAPTWSDFLGMGWYPGMAYYGGYWGYHPYGYGGYGFSPMAGLFFNIGGRPYYGWNSYHSYSYANPYNRVYVNSAPSYRYSSVGRSAPSSFGRGSSYGGSRTSGSFGRTSSGFGRSTGTTGSFGRSTSSFGSSGSRPGGSFGSGSSGTSSFGRRSSGSFGSGSSGFGSSGSSFGRSSSFGGSSGSSFGRSSSFGGGSSFGGSRSSSGGGSFGGGHSSFGGGRRR